MTHQFPHSPAIDRCATALQQAHQSHLARREVIRNMPRVRVLEAYKARMQAEIADVPFPLNTTKPQFYLARAAERLIYLNYNRAACEAIGRGKYASDRAIMDEVIAAKNIGRGKWPLRSPISFHHGMGNVVTFSHVGGAA